MTMINSLILAHIVLTLHCFKDSLTIKMLLVQAHVAIHFFKELLTI